MPSLFTGPLETLTAADLQQAIGWPESLTVEFKREIPGQNGQPDGWTTGGKVAVYGRDRLFKEIVALANTAGGNLLLGVDEDRSVTPPVGRALTPVPRCAELADRLIKMAQSIDPPISQLTARGVETAGDAGVVVIRVPNSPSLPHRSTDKDCYVRRGTDSVPISMREMHDMVLSAERRGEVIDQAFAKTADKFRVWMKTPLRSQMPTSIRPHGFRVTAVPIGGVFELPRLYGRWEHGRLKGAYTLVNGATGPSGGVTANTLRKPNVTRSALRGIEMRFRDTDNPSYFSVQTNGTVSSGFRTVEASASGRPAQIYLLWVLGYMLDTLRLADMCRTEAGIPECEYAIEVEFASLSNDVLEMHAWGVGFSDHLGNLTADQLPIVFPRLSYGNSSEAGNVISRFADDFYDLAEAVHEEPFNLHIYEPG